MFAATDAASAKLGFKLPLPVALSALTISHVLGEGIGRFACTSIGCCYGNPVEGTRGWVRRLARACPFVTCGRTKKIALAAGLDSARVVPTQAMTATVHSALALIGLWQSFSGRYERVIPVALTTSQIRRVYSGTLRTDHCGRGRITAHQIVAAIMVSRDSLRSRPPAGPRAYLSLVSRRMHPAVAARYSCCACKEYRWTRFGTRATAPRPGPSCDSKRAPSGSDPYSGPLPATMRKKIGARLNSML